jgi:mannosyltransferase
MLPQMSAIAEQDLDDDRLVELRSKNYSAWVWSRQHQSIFECAVLGCIIIAAIALRFFRLGQWSFWEDEIFTISDAQNVLPQLRVFPPPSFSTLLTAAVLAQLGTSEWTARLVSAAIGIVSIPLLYFPIRAFSNRTTALLFAALLAFAPWHIMWSQTARFYSSLMLFYAFAMLAFFAAMERDSLGWLSLAIVFLGVATGERLTALLFVPVAAVYLALVWLLRFERPPGMRTRNLLPVALMVTVVVLYEIYKWYTAGDHVFREFFTTFVGNPIRDPFRLLFNIFYNLNPPLVGFGLLVGIYLLSRRSRLGLFLLVSSILPIVLLELMSPIVFVVDRYALVTLSAWVWLAAFGIAETIKSGTHAVTFFGWGFLVALLAASMQWAVIYYTINDGNHADWRTAFSIVQARMQPGDIVVSTWPEVGDYYLQTDVLRFGKLDPQAIADTRSRNWFVIDPPTSWTNTSLKEWLETHGTLIGVLPIRAPEDESIWVYFVDTSMQFAH